MVSTSLPCGRFFAFRNRPPSNSLQSIIGSLLFCFSAPSSVPKSERISPADRRPPAAPDSALRASQEIQLRQIRIRGLPRADQLHVPRTQLAPECVVGVHRGRRLTACVPEAGHVAPGLLPLW